MIYLENGPLFFVKIRQGSGVLREGLQWKAHSEARARTCNGKPDGKERLEAARQCGRKGRLSGTPLF